MLSKKHRCGPVQKQSIIEGRIVSVDALRGFDMFWIIGGAAIFKSMAKIKSNSVTQMIQEQLSHVKWEGFRAWDLIMPLFLFITGVVIPFSLSKRVVCGVGPQEDLRHQKEIYFHIFKRTLILFLLGMVVQGHLLTYELSKIHLYSNTLQAIAAGYLIASMIMLNFNTKKQIIVLAGLLLLFWALMVLVPVPGYGRAELTPEGNVAIYLDKLIMGRFQDGTTYTWILSSITFGCTVMLGGIAGQILRCKKTGMERVFWLSAAGIGCLMGGWIWGMWFPIIKHIWTSSFVLFSGGWCFLLLALFYLLIDVLGFQRWAFVFVVIGMNAVSVYVATQLFDFRQVGNIFVGGLAKYVGNWNDFIQSLASLTVVWLILYWMYRRKSFIKI